VEETRFDEMTKVLGSLKTRRLTLGALLGGALGTLGLAEAEAAKKKKKRKKKCKNLGPCERCQRGKKKTQPNGTTCSTGLGNGQCANGACIVQAAPVPVPPPPGNPCVGLGNPCTQGAAPPNACCEGVCGKELGNVPTKCCNRGPNALCNTPETVGLCCLRCNASTNPPTCACKPPGDACDDNSQCCSNQCVTSGTTRTCG
jgi:hypothetical protein